MQVQLTAIHIKEGDTVKEGVVILKVKTAATPAVTQVETAQAAPVEAAAAKRASNCICTTNSSISSG